MSERVVAMTGAWKSYALLGPDEVEKDRAVLETLFRLSDDVFIKRADVYVHGRWWVWEGAEQ